MTYRTSQSDSYRKRLHPWCIIRQLPNFQRITVARFRRRNEAEEHLNVLRRLVPRASFIVLFDAQVEPMSLKYPECPLLKHLASSASSQITLHNEYQRRLESRGYESP